MHDIDSFNKLLKSVKNAQDLIDIYLEYEPYTIKSEKDDPSQGLFYCSGAAKLVLTYFIKEIKKTKIIDALDIDPNQIPTLSQGNVDTIWSGLRKIKENYVGVLQSAGSFGHLATFVGMPSKDQWAFYQANVNAPKNEQSTLVPLLNPDKTNWCLNDMTESQFESLLKGLTNKKRIQSIIPLPENKVDHVLPWLIQIYYFSGKPVKLDKKLFTVKN